MAAGWRQIKLGEVLTTLTDYHANGSYKKLKANVELLDEPNYAVMIRTKNFEQIDFSTDLKYITESAYEFLGKSKVFPGDILMNKIANAGSVYFMPNLERPVSLAMNLFLLRTDPDVTDQRFIFYNMKANEAYIKLFASGTAAKTITKNAVRNLDLKIPSLETQRKIASVLSAYDDLIKNNRRRIKILEEMARMIYREWFVKFRFPGHEKVQMVDSPLGKIPKGWEVVKLESQIEIKHGFAFKGEYFKKEPPGDILLTPGNFAVGGGFKGDKYKYYEGPVPEDYVLTEDDLIVTMTDLSKAGDTLGYPAFVPTSDGPKFLHNQRLGKISLKPDSIVSFNFLFLLFVSDGYRHHVLASATGATVRHTSPSRILNYRFAIQPNSLLSQFEKTIEPLRELKKSLKQKNRNLRQTRDLLLPKLVSGKLDVEKYQ